MAMKESGALEAPIPRDRAAGVPLLAIVVGVLFSLLWTSAFTAAKIAVASAPPLTLLTARFVFSGAIAVALAFAMGERPPVGRSAWLGIVTLGISQNATYLALIFFAVREVPAALAAIIASALPLTVATVSSALGRERPGGMVVIGLVCGFAGVVVALFQRVNGDASAFGIALCLLALGSLTVATMTVSRFRMGNDFMMIVGLQMLVGALTLGPLALIFESLADVKPSLELTLAFLHLALIPGLLATFVWFKLIHWIGPTRASVFHFLNPPFAVGMSWAVLGEPITSATTVGVVLITLGILLVQAARLDRGGKAKAP